MYVDDGRRSVSELLELYQEVLKAASWDQEVIHYQDKYPIVAFKSPAARNASPMSPVDCLWIEGGVHGEEPASGEAFANEISSIAGLGKTVPIVFLPLLNPVARDKDWRYENEYRDFHIGESVTDSEHLLLALNEYGYPVLPYQPRKDKPVSKTAAAITSWVLEASISCRPLLVIDHHEDRVAEQYQEGDPRNISSCYVYVSGEGSASVDVARAVIGILKDSGMPVGNGGMTRFGEPIIEQGIVLNAADGSMDELHASPLYFDFVTKTAKNKPAADTVIVVETTVPYRNPIPLGKRVTAHQAVIQNYGLLWEKVQNAR